MQTDPNNKETKTANGKVVFGNPEYSAEDDIYSREKKESLDEVEPPTAIAGETNTEGSGLDVPGSELDDAEEKTGEEDEENNFYSLGGDDHNDLEEGDGG
jgi:hypothetical protein